MVTFARSRLSAWHVARHYFYEVQGVNVTGLVFVNKKRLLVIVKKIFFETVTAEEITRINSVLKVPPIMFYDKLFANYILSFVVMPF